MRPVSWPFSAQCLMVEMMLLDWMPRIWAPTIVPASSGSSPPYSKLRPLRGSRARLTPPASWTLKPEERASEPIIAPPLKASSGFQVAAVARPEGREVRSRIRIARLALGGHADAGVGFPLRRHAQARDPGDVAGRAHASLGVGVNFGLVLVRAEIAEHQGQFLVLRHLRNDQVGALIGAQPGVHPRFRGARARRPGRERRLSAAPWSASRPGPGHASAVASFFFLPLTSLPIRATFRVNSCGLATAFQLFTKLNRGFQLSRK
jgi:hypothetical protein